MGPDKLDGRTSERWGKELRVAQVVGTRGEMEVIDEDVKCEPGKLGRSGDEQGEEEELRRPLGSSTNGPLRGV